MLRSSTRLTVTSVLHSNDFTAACVLQPLTVNEGRPWELGNVVKSRLNARTTGWNEDWQPSRVLAEITISAEDEQKNSEKASRL